MHEFEQKNNEFCTAPVAMSFDGDIWRCASCGKPVAADVLQDLRHS